MPFLFLPGITKQLYAPKTSRFPPTPEPTGLVFPLRFNAVGITNVCGKDYIMGHQTGFQVGNIWRATVNSESAYMSYTIIPEILVF
jgi:hypothetical protein